MGGDGVRRRTGGLRACAEQAADPATAYGEGMVQLISSLSLAIALPAAPALERWTLEQPVPLTLALLTAGMVALVVLRRRGRLMAGVVALVGAVLAAAGVALAGWSVQTPREAMTRSTRALVAGVFAGDRGGVDDLLGPEVLLVVAGEVSDAFERGDVLGVTSRVGELGVSEWDQRVRGAVVDGPDAGRTAVMVRARGAMTSEFPTSSTWIISWRRSPGDAWRAERLECVEVFGRRPDAKILSHALRLARQGPAPDGDEGVRHVPGGMPVGR